MKDMDDFTSSNFNEVMKQAEKLLAEIYDNVTSDWSKPEQVCLTFGEISVLRFCTRAPYRSIRVYNARGIRVYCLTRRGRFHSEWNPKTVVSAVQRIFTQKRGVLKEVKESHVKWSEEQTSKIIAATLTAARLEAEAPYKYLCGSSEYDRGIQLLPDIDKPGGLMLSLNMDLRCSEEQAKRIGQLLFYALLDVTPGEVAATPSQYGCKH